MSAELKQARPRPSALFDLEEKFWQSIVDRDVETALNLLAEPALMVSSQGTFKFDHAGYRAMSQKGTMQLMYYDLTDMDATFPNDDTAVLTYKVKQVLRPKDRSPDITQDTTDSSTWVREHGRWLCVAHTETPAIDTHERTKP